eukprot:scaffold10511_cov129-Isochrysis_galbana.AAC.9
MCASALAACAGALGQAARRSASRARIAWRTNGTAFRSVRRAVAGAMSNPCARKAAVDEPTSSSSSTQQCSTKLGSRGQSARPMGAKKRGSQSAYSRRAAGLSLTVSISSSRAWSSSSVCSRACSSLSPGSAASCARWSAGNSSPRMHASRKTSSFRSRVSTSAACH